MGSGAKRAIDTGAGKRYRRCMPERSSRANRPRDLNQLSASIVGEATDDKTGAVESDGPLVDPDKNPHAVALGRLGGKKGGPARAKKLSPERRREIARSAATARWRPDPPPSP